MTRLVGTLLALLTTFAIVTSAFAAGNDEEEEKPASSAQGAVARQKFAEGNEKYARGDYLGSVEAFKAAIAADPSLPGPYRNLGLAYRALDRCSDALPMYEKYLQMRPESRFTERVKREIDLCRSKLGMEPLHNETPQVTGTPHPAEAQSFLHVAADLMGGEATDEASVRVDGIMRGPTPITVPVTPGVHKVHLEHPGFESADAVVEVQPGARRDIELTMNKLPEAPAPQVAVTPAEKPRKSLRKVGWGLIGAAAACAVVGAGFGIAESKVHRDAVAIDPMSTTRDTVNKKADDGHNLAIGAWVGLSVGGAALAAAVVVFILDGERGETHEAQKYVIAPTVTQGGGGLAAAVRF